MTIIRRAGRENPYAQIVRAMLRDTRLPIDTRGMVALLMSMPPSWEVRATWLEEACGVGRVRRRRMVREATRAGYMRRMPKRDASTGRVSGWDYEVVDIPRSTERQVTRPTVHPPDGSPTSLESRDSHPKRKVDRIDRRAVENSRDDDSALRALDGYADDLALALGVTRHVAVAWTLDMIARAGSAAAVRAALDRAMPRVRAGDAGGSPQRTRAYLEAAILGKGGTARQRSTAGTAGAHASAIVADLRRHQR